jgi:PhnB protein
MFRIGDTPIMASDGLCLGQPAFQGFSLALTVSEVAETEQIFEALAIGGHITVPLNQTFFSPSFGMLTDRFGVAWTVYATPPQQ